MNSTKPKTFYVRLRYNGNIPCRDTPHQKAAEERKILRTLEEGGDNIRTRKIFPLPDGFKLQVLEEKDADKILEEKCRERLTKIG